MSLQSKRRDKRRRGGTRPVSGALKEEAWYKASLAAVGISSRRTGDADRFESRDAKEGSGLPADLRNDG